MSDISLSWRHYQWYPLNVCTKCTQHITFTRIHTLFYFCYTLEWPIPNSISPKQPQRIPQPQPTSLQQLHKFQTPPHLTLAPTDGMIDTIVMSPNVAAIQQNPHQAFITSKNSALLPPPNQNKYGHIHNVSDLCLIFPL